MRPPASTAHRRTRPPLHRTVAATVVVSVVLLSLLRLPIADARTLRYHRKHRRHHRHGQYATNNGSNISQPPAALPPDVGGDSPAEPPALPPDIDHAPPPRSRHDKPCTPPNPHSRVPAFSPVGAPRSPAPAKPPAFSPAKPPSPSPAKAPSHSHAKPPSIYLAKPPALPPAEPHTLPGAKPPPVSPVRAPSMSPTKAPPAPFSHSKPPSTSSSHTKPLPCTPVKPPQAEPPRLSPAKPPIMPPPAKPPQLSPAKLPMPSPSHPPRHSPANPAKPPIMPPPSKPPQLSPAKLPMPSPSHPPRHSPAKPPIPAPSQPPRLSPATPSAQAPAPKPTAPLHPAIPPVAAKPPALPPALLKAKSPSSPPPASALAAKNSSAVCSNVFDVREFGASGNGSCDDTRAFRAAWKAACSAESATLLVPSDGVFTVTSTIFSGPCKPRLTFQIDGVLMPPDGPASWPAADSRRQWIVFYKTDGMTLTGRGTIEGNGEEWWNLPCKPHRGPNGSTLPGPCDSPALIRFFVSNNVTVQGLRIENSPQFHLKFDGCERVLVDGLFVSSPAFSPNTDGIHVENTTSVQIYNSRINNGDDCISIGAGCSNVHIENVTCGHGHGISIGSLGVHNTRACVSNITVRNARILNSDNGVRIKTWQGGAGSVSAVEFAGVRMDNVKNCIVIDQYYCIGSGCANQTSAVRVDGVTYRDIRGTYNPQAGAPIHFACSDSVACTDITMTDVELLPAGSDGGAQGLLADPYCWNAYGVMETITLPPVYCLQEGRPDSLQDQLSSC